MGRYLDSLNEQFDEITSGIESTLDRAADEGREVTKDEQELVERDTARADELKKSIEHYSGIEQTRGRVAELRGKTPSSPRQTSTTVVVEREKEPDAELHGMFPTIGDYIVTIGRAMRGDREAGELIERATAHQLLADNPGIVPRPIVGPVINTVNASRPFINSIQSKRLPAGSFDRPKITQHVAVGIQAVEKTLTESQKLLLGKLPVVAKTFAGHLNISRQDIKWTSPGIMQIVAEDFAYIYGQETNADAVASFVASVTSAAVPADLTAAGVVGALFDAAAASLSAGGPLPDTLWTAPDIWGDIGGLVNDHGVLVFPSVTPTSAAGNVLGIRVVVDPNFAAGTSILGPSRFAEWYEDVDGFMSVQEPDVLGQLVGYAGYGAFLNTEPGLFTKLTITEPVVPLAAKSSK